MAEVLLEALGFPTEYWASAPAPEPPSPLWALGSSLAVPGALLVLPVAAALIKRVLAPQLPAGAEKEAALDYGKHRTVVGLVAATWSRLLDENPATGAIPVEALLDAMALQSQSAQRIGGVMRLVRTCDEANMQRIRSSWEAHGRPSTIRELVECEKRSGVQRAPGRLKESATLALLWSTRMIEFWLGMVQVLADPLRLHSSSSSSTDLPAHASNVVYATTIEPFHGFLLRSTFRAALRALPSREEMLRRLAGRGAKSAAGGAKEGAKAAEEAEALAPLLDDCKRCSAVTARVVATLRGMLEELQLHDEQQV